MKECNRKCNSTTESMKDITPPKSNMVTNNITVNLSLKDTDAFNNLLEVIRSVTKDERISEEVRQEYIGKLRECIGDNNGTKTT